MNRQIRNDTAWIFWYCLAVGIAVALLCAGMLYVIYRLSGVYAG